MALVQSHLSGCSPFPPSPTPACSSLGSPCSMPGRSPGWRCSCSPRLLKGALFMCAGVFLHRWGTVSIASLHGRGRAEVLAGLMFVVAIFGLVGVPPFGTLVGKELISTPPAMRLRLGGDRLRGGVGPQRRRRASCRGTRLPRPRVGGASTGPAQRAAEHYETVEARSRTPLVMLLPIVALVVAGLGLALAPGLVRGAEHTCGALLDSHAVCRGGHRRHPRAAASHAAESARGRRSQQWRRRSRQRRRSGGDPPAGPPSEDRHEPRRRRQPVMRPAPRAALRSRRRLHRLAHGGCGNIRRDTGCRRR